MRIPYERLVAWLAGPISIAAGAVAVWLDNHFGLLGKAGLGSDQTAKGINDALTFAVGAGVTYLSQAKWMNNLAAWWNHAQTNQGSSMTTEDTPQEPVQEPEPQVGEPEPEETETLEDGEGEDVGPDVA